MIKLANCTLHDQAQYEKDFAYSGFEIVTEPMGFEVKATDNAQAIKNKVEETLDLICADTHASAILVGGLSSVTYYFVTGAFGYTWKVFEVVTERTRDAEGKFVFNFRGLREILNVPYNPKSAANPAQIVIKGCRETKQGALTTAGGKQINVSKTGRHWDEVISGPVGHNFIVKDISNSGKHHCYRAKITGAGKFEVIQTSTGQPCLCEEKGD